MSFKEKIAFEEAEAQMILEKEAHMERMRKKRAKFTSRMNNQVRAVWEGVEIETGFFGDLTQPTSSRLGFTGWDPKACVSLCMLVEFNAADNHLFWSSMFFIADSSGHRNRFPKSNRFSVEMMMMISRTNKLTKDKSQASSNSVTLTTQPYVQPRCCLLSSPLSLVSLCFSGLAL